MTCEALLAAAIAVSPMLKKSDENSITSLAVIVSHSEQLRREAKRIEENDEKIDKFRAAIAVCGKAK